MRDRIRKCFCGSQAELAAYNHQYTHGTYYYVRCTKLNCWIGPDAQTSINAILAWNLIASRAK